MPASSTWSRAFVVALLSVAVLSGACGGSLAPVGDGGTDGGSSVYDAPVAVVDSPVTVDAPESVDAPTSCQVDGVPCFMAIQCCTGACSSGFCGGATIGPSCLADGAGCAQPSDCCSDSCNGGVCGEVTSTCASSPNATACQACLAQTCCMQETACESDPQCVSAVTCVEACDGGTSCEGMCLAKGRDTTTLALFQCAQSGCAASCQ